MLISRELPTNIYGSKKKVNTDGIHALPSTIHQPSQPSEVGFFPPGGPSSCTRHNNFRREPGARPKAPTIPTVKITSLLDQKNVLQCNVIM